MRTYVHLITAAAILVHATLGCCAHEGHSLIDAVCGHHHNEVGTQDCHDENEQVPLQLEADHSCGEHAQHPTDPTHPAPQTCTHAQCMWPAPEMRDGSDLIQMDFLFALTPVLDAFFVSLFPVGESTLTFSVAHSPHALPVRAHLANCVFLI